MRVLGIMSGTSVDAVDYALCDVTPSTIHLRKHWQVEFPKTLRKRIVAAADNRASSHETGQLHHDLGRFYAEGAERLPRGSQPPELVGFHGQTVYHNPAVADRRATFQIGEPAYLAEALRVPVIANFRVGDIAAGGQGAPLASLFHQHVFARPGLHVCVNNLGGISNVTSLDWQTSKIQVAAFDTGPANVLIDTLMRTFTGGRTRFDRNGDFAKSGKINEVCLQRWMNHPFLGQQPPKSTGREIFGVPFFERTLREMKKFRLSENDMAATLTEFTARSIVRNYELHLPSPPSVVILCGGGAMNGNLKSRIEANLRSLETICQLKTCEDYGWPAQAVEPAAFALLAYQRIKGKPGNIPSTTGAKRAVLLGQITEA